MTHAPGQAAEGREQVRERIGPAIREGPLEVRPHEFVRIELGRVRWEAFDVEAGTPRAQRPDIRALVDRPAVPEHDHVAPQMPEQGAEEERDLHVGDVLVRMEVEVQAEPPPLGAERDGGDGRDLVPAVAVTDQRGVPPRRPGAAHGRDQQKARLVEEHQMGVQAPGFFLTATQRTRFHCAIAASSRSTARRSGF